MGKFFKQYGALPYRVRRGSVEVLLITSRETRRWIVPKGWPKKSARSTAKSEAYEESGVRGKVSAQALGSFNYWKEIGARKIRCRLKVFPLAVKTRAKKWPEREERQTRWFKLKKAAQRCGDPGLARLVRKLGRQMRAL